MKLATKILFFVHFSVVACSTAGLFSGQGPLAAEDGRQRAPANAKDSGFSSQLNGYFELSASPSIKGEWIPGYACPSALLVEVLESGQILRISNLSFDYKETGKQRTFQIESKGSASGGYQYQASSFGFKETKTKLNDSSQKIWESSERLVMTQVGELEFSHSSKRHFSLFDPFGPFASANEIFCHYKRNDVPNESLLNSRAPVSCDVLAKQDCDFYRSLRGGSDYSFWLRRSVRPITPNDCALDSLLSSQCRKE